MRFSRVRTKIKSIKLNKEPRLRKTRKKLERKRKEEDIKENKINKKYEMVVSPEWKLMPLKPQKAKIRSNIIARALKKTFLR